MFTDQGGERQELINNVCKPGNLVWGTQIQNSDHANSLFTKGIKTAREINRAEYGYTSQSICLALLSKMKPPYNYGQAGDLGPKMTQNSLSVIINRHKILKSFPNKVVAYGGFFYSDRTRVSLYEYDPDKKTVFDIPIKFPRSDHVWLDEVRIESYSDEDRKIHLPTIPIDGFWEGIVISKELFQNIREQWRIKTGICIPIFDTDFKLLDMAL